ncbi:flagellar motor protein MotB [Dehalobacter sp. DCM]|uniref:OmpA/MotB family protein n=1 Tax=Dehalobacter sp. DCM TaxID=2907827 RepID=UPI003081696C|nr:flagellar motor protein MotB [Dehalobacter sp. DCM]
MAKKKKHDEEHMDETWLLPYSDLLTLMLALFIAMFAISQVDKAKAQALAEAFQGIFNGQASLMESEGSSVIEQGDPAPTDVKVIEQDMMQELKEKLEKEISQSGYQDKVKVHLDKEGLEIVIQDVMLFNSGDAQVLDNVSRLLLEIAKLLNTTDNYIKIVGHTDDRPIHNSQFRSNWDLSVIRAINVMNYLVVQGQVKPERFTVQGYGQYSPAADNLTEEGRAKNRRVEIFLIRKYPITDSNPITDNDNTSSSEPVTNS